MKEFRNIRGVFSALVILLPLFGFGTIIDAEYFLNNNDNGPGLNTSMSVDVMDGIATATASGISTSGLGAGVHLIYSRLYDDGYGWGAPQGRPFLITTEETTHAITSAEYFLDDDDSGPGNNTVLSLSVSSGVATATTTGLSTSGLSAGVHMVYSRFYADNHGWGPLHGYPFFITTPQTEIEISAGEYFIDDNDNGPGSNTALTLNVSNGVATGTASAISTTGLESGIHVIYSRMYAAGSGWGPPKGYPFYITNPGDSYTISSAEYFIDSDPGFGNGTELTLTGSDTQVSMGTDFDLSDASPGMHRLYLRLHSPEVGWGPVTSALFVVEQDAQINFVQSAQYFIGSSPDAAEIVTIESPEDGTFDELNETIALTDVSIPDGASGLQTVGIRYQHSNGQWSDWRTSQFLVVDDAPAYTIMGAEYYLDTDPGPGNGTAIEEPNDGSYDEIEEEFDLPVSVDGLAEGGHVAYLRLQRSDGNWSAPRGSYFIVSEDAQPTIAAAEYYVNPATPEGGGISFAPADGAFNTTEEDVSAIANMASLNAQEVGNYQLYVRFMNSRGEWGEATSQAFTVETRPQITTSVDSLDFGALFTGETRQLEITISNVGDEDLLVSSIDFNDGAYTSDWSSGTIPPLGSETATITFAPVDPAGSHPAMMTIVNNDADKNIVLEGIGLDTAPIMEVSPDSLSFGTVQTIANATLSIRVSNTGNEDLVLSGATSTSPAFSASIPNPTVVPNEYVDVDITFAPSLGETYTDTLYLISNDTYYPSFPVYVTGVGSVVPVPDIQVSVEALAFGNIELSDAPTQLNFIIHNAGTEVLNISSSTIDEAAFTANLASNTSINPSTSLSVSVSFTPTESRRYSGNFTIYNDDPDSPEISIMLSGSSVFPGMVLSSNTFSFGEVGVTTSATQSLIITNIGSDTLKISSFQKSAELDTIFSISPASFNLNPAGGIRNFSLVFSPAEPIEYTGTVIILSNDENDTLYITGTGLDDEPPEIVFDPEALEDVGTSENSSLTISAPISDNNQLSWVRLFYRQGGKTEYDSTDMDLQAGEYQGIIPPAYVRNRGVEYYIKAFDGANAQVIPETAPDVPAIVRVRLPSLPPFTFTAETYGMISVPSDLDAKSVRSNLEGDIGDYDIHSWRLFRWINGTYVELSENDNFTFDPGNAYWLITADRQVITLDSSTSVKTNEDYLISLDQGWNQVGTPYYFPVSWNDVYAASPGVVQGSIAYEWVENEWQPATTMQPFGGYFISTSSGGSILRFPPREAAAGTGKLTGSPIELADNEWIFKVSATSDTQRDRFNYFGVLADAEEGLDINDQPKPPPMYPDQLQIGSKHSDWGKQSGSFSGDFHPSSPNGNYWDLTLETGSENETIFLSLEQYGDLPENFSVRVLNLDLRYELQALEGGVYEQEVFSPGASYQIRVLIGNDGYLSENDAGIGQIPEQFRLSQNYPNPFNAGTHIQYDIPRPGAVSVVIYDMMGRVVREVIQTSAHPAGYHELYWDGLNASGSSVASGIYLISLRTPEFQATRKMVLLK